jgi:hypothetical protein
MPDVDEGPPELYPERVLGRPADLDLGGTHRVWFYTDDTGQRTGLIDAHQHKTDPDGWHHHSSVLFDLPGVDGYSSPGRPLWQVHSLGPLHLEPSLACTCGDHGFIRAGRWEAC